MASGKPAAIPTKQHLRIPEVYSQETHILDQKLRVLVISQHFWPETFRINEVVESLRACGMEVEVLSGQPNYPKGKIFEGYSAFGTGTQIHPAGYPIYRVPVVPRGKGGGLVRVANYFSFVVTSSLLGVWLTRSKKYDIIFVYAISPILQGLTGFVFKKLKMAALVIWVQDLWPDSLEATGFVKNKHALATVASITRFIYTKADLLLAQSRGFMIKIQEMTGGSVPIGYHPNPGDIALAKKMTQEISPLKMKPGFNVVFAGNLGSVQALETILDSASQLSDPEIHILLVGTGSQSEWVRTEIVRRGLKNVELSGRFPADAMPGIFAQASALLVTLRRAENLSLTVPSKIASYLAAARPVIACLDGEGADIIREARAGLTVPAEDANALASAIFALKNMPEYQRDAMAAAGRAYFERHLAPGPLAWQLVHHFRDALSRRKCAAAYGKSLQVDDGSRTLN